MKAALRYLKLSDKIECRPDVVGAMSEIEFPNQCWIWQGDTKMPYTSPAKLRLDSRSVSVNKTKPRPEMKVGKNKTSVARWLWQKLLAPFDVELTSEFMVRRYCPSELCVNPLHHEILGRKDPITQETPEVPLEYEMIVSKHHFHRGYHAAGNLD